MDPNRTRIKSQPQTTAGPVGLFVGLAPLRHYIEFGQDADGVIAIVAASVRPWAAPLRIYRLTEFPVFHPNQ